MKNQGQEKTHSILYSVSLLFASVLLVLGIWFSSGTLAMYAATLDRPLILEPCGYLVNLDHAHFQGGYAFIAGLDRAFWVDSIYLRRILYPLLAFPFMKNWGFMYGGVLFNMILSVVAVITFVRFMRIRYGQSAALTSLWLLATYPGIMYWAGLPYVHAMIVPNTLWGFMLFTAIWENEDLRKFVVYVGLLGILCLGYDLLPYFLSALVFLLVLKRAWLLIPLGAFVLTVPLIILLSVLRWGFEVPVVNSNSGVYLSVLGAYFQVPDFVAWWEILKGVPKAFVITYFASNFLVLPLLFLITLIVSKWKIKTPLHPVEWAFLFCVLLVFLFNHLAPPYEAQWQMRDLIFSRLYQPVFVVFIVFVSRFFGELRRFEGAVLRHGFLLTLFGATLLNAYTVFGASFGQLEWPSKRYFNFYPHANSHEAMGRNLKLHGVRPLGVCASEEQA